MRIDPKKPEGLWRENKYIDEKLDLSKTDYKKFAEASKRVAKVEAEAEESQKPSARIEAIVKRKVAIVPYEVDVHHHLNIQYNAILVYLDEQYDERNGGR